MSTSHKAIYRRPDALDAVIEPGHDVRVGDWLTSIRSSEAQNVLACSSGLLSPCAFQLMLLAITIWFVGIDCQIVTFLSPGASVFQLVCGSALSRTLISILLLRQRWRTSINRFAETALFAVARPNVSIFRLVVHG
jgi:hypothetical protein